MTFPAGASFKAIVGRSMALATGVAQAYGNANMLAAVRITRGGAPSWVNNAWVDGPSRAVYTGPARVYLETSAAPMDLGDEPVYFTTTYVTIPITAQTPEINDIVVVTDHPDLVLIGAAYRVITVEKGGMIPAVRRLTVTGVTASSGDPLTNDAGAP